MLLFVAERCKSECTRGGSQRPTNARRALCGRSGPVATLECFHTPLSSRSSSRQCWRLASQQSSGFSSLPENQPRSLPPRACLQISTSTSIERESASRRSRQVRARFSPTPWLTAPSPIPRHNAQNSRTRTRRRRTQITLIAIDRWRASRAAVSATPRAHSEAAVSRGTAALYPGIRARRATPTLHHTYAFCPRHSHTHALAPPPRALPSQT